MESQSVNGTSASANVGVAMALTCGAGAATALGAAVVFVPSLVKLASKRVLAGGLGLSAGVMTYVSFVEIFKKSYTSFEDAGFEHGAAYAIATGCFFGGVVFMVVRTVKVNERLVAVVPAGNRKWRLHLTNGVSQSRCSLVRHSYSTLL